MTPWATATRSSSSSNTMKPDAPRPDWTSRSSSKPSGVSKRSAGRIGLATPESAATSERPLRAPPPIWAMASASEVPIGTSATPWRRVLPVMVTTVVPGEVAVPSSRNQSGPWAMIPGMLARVSTLLASAGGPSPRPGDASSSASVSPRRYGGAMRGKGMRPATTSSRAVSSPNR